MTSPYASIITSVQPLLLLALLLALAMAMALLLTSLLHTPQGAEPIVDTPKADLPGQG